MSGSVQKSSSSSQPAAQSKSPPKSSGSGSDASKGPRTANAGSAAQKGSTSSTGQNTAQSQSQGRASSSGGTGNANANNRNNNNNGAQSSGRTQNATSQNAAPAAQNGSLNQNQNQNLNQNQNNNNNNPLVRDMLTYSQQYANGDTASFSYSRNLAGPQSQQSAGGLLGQNGVTNNNNNGGGASVNNNGGATPSALQASQDISALADQLASQGGQYGPLADQLRGMNNAAYGGSNGYDAQRSGKSQLNLNGQDPNAYFGGQLSGLADQLSGLGGQWGGVAEQLRSMNSQSFGGANGSDTQKGPRTAGSGQPIGRTQAAGPGALTGGGGTPSGERSTTPSGYNAYQVAGAGENKQKITTAADKYGATEEQKAGLLAIANMESENFAYKDNDGKSGGAENFGLYRMNRAQILQAGYGEGDLARINSDPDFATQVALASMDKFKQAGGANAQDVGGVPRGFLLQHRFGESGLNGGNANDPYMRNFEQNQQAYMSNADLQSNDERLNINSTYAI